MVTSRHKHTKRVLSIKSMVILILKWMTRRPSSSTQIVLLIVLVRTRILYFHAMFSFPWQRKNQNRFWFLEGGKIVWSATIDWICCVCVCGTLPDRVTHIEWPMSRLSHGPRATRVSRHVLAKPCVSPACLIQASMVPSCLLYFFKVHSLDSKPIDFEYKNRRLGLVACSRQIRTRSFELVGFHLTNISAFFWLSLVRLLLAGRERERQSRKSNGIVISSLAWALSLLPALCLSISTLNPLDDSMTVTYGDYLPPLPLLLSYAKWIIVFEE